LNAAACNASASVCAISSVPTPRSIAIDSAASAVASATPDQGLREPQAHERHGLLATTDIQPDVERLGQQRL